MRTLGIGLTMVLLAACSASSQRPDMVRERIQSELVQAATNRRGTEAADKAILAPLVVDLPKFENSNSEPRFDLSIVNAPAVQAFMAIVSGTRYNMLVGPEVSGNITVNLKDVTVKEALEAIRELYGYEFTLKGNRISIQPNTLQTRVFQVNYLASRRQGATELRVTSSAIVGSGATATSGTTTPMPAGTSSTSGSSSLTSRVQTHSDSDFWHDLQTALSAIVTGEGRSIVVNSISGVVVVRAFPSELRSVEQYLKATQVVVDRQVMLEAKILEVRLSEQFQSGINWSSFHGNNHRMSLIGAVPGTTLQANGGGDLVSNDVTVSPGLAGSVVASALGGGFIGLALQTANFAALLNFLETQGSVSVLSSPRIATINNQKAVLKVGTDELFVTNVTTTTVSNGAGPAISTPSLTLQPYFSGISLDVMPQIDDEGNIILHVHPAVSVVTEKNKAINLGDMGNYNLPLATSSINETDSIVRVQDGNIVAIGGLMTQEQTSDNAGLPGTMQSTIGALFGQRGRSLTKREMVILLKPTIIRDDRTWVKDLEQNSERLRGFGLPPLSVPVN